MSSGHLVMYVLAKTQNSWCNHLTYRKISPIQYQQLQEVMQSDGLIHYSGYYDGTSQQYQLQLTILKVDEIITLKHLIGLPYCTQFDLIEPILQQIESAKKPPVTII
jgi:hypothetical protein